MTVPSESLIDLTRANVQPHDRKADMVCQLTKESPAAHLIRTRSTRLGPGTTIEDFLPECRKVWGNSIDPHGSLESYESAVTHHIRPFFEGTALRDWDEWLIIKFIEELNGKEARTAKGTCYPDRRKLTKRSKKRILAIFSGICRLAIVHGLLDRNPAKDYGRLLKQYGEQSSPSEPKETRHQRARPIAKWKALTIEERDRVLMTARKFLSLRYYAYYLVLAGTGVRPSEAAALRWKHLDLEGETTNGVPVVHIRVTVKRGGKHIGQTKSGRDRVVELDPAVVEVLMALKAIVPHNPKNFVFTRPNGRLFSQAFRNNVWAVILGLAGLTRWLPVYCLRHTYASILINHDVSITFVSQQLGHYDDEVTRITYYHWMPVNSNPHLARLRLRGL